MKKRIHRGSDLRDFLREEGILVEVEERALKEAIALQFSELLWSLDIIRIGLHRTLNRTLHRSVASSTMRQGCSPWTN
jgi:hypothetical protein